MPATQPTALSASEAALVAAGAGTWRVDGPLTFDSVPGLRPRGLTLLEAAEGALLFDLQGVASADSAGLALLIDWLAEARSKGRSLRYVGVPETLQALAGLSEVGALISP